jgi:hypothetical protein
MNYTLGFYRAIAMFALAAFSAAPALSQAPAAPAAAARVAAAPAAASGTAAAGRSGGWVTVNSPFRHLAPGVMQDVDPTRHADETSERHNVTELLYVDPNFDFAKDVTFPHQVWMLEIKYKPVRMIWADIPGDARSMHSSTTRSSATNIPLGAEGKMLRKQIWYIVYQVTNPGKAYQPVEKDDELNKLDVSGKLYKLETVDKPVRFTPVFTLETHNRLVKEKPGFSKAAVEQYIPVVLPAIRDREDRNREFLTSQEMSQHEIRVGETVWGVATWQDVDPNNVWFSVYVEGLTNAYKWNDDPAKYAAFRAGASKAPFREISTKVLKLNFWRAGDEFTVRETQVRTGVPELPGGPKLRPAFEWVWWRTYPPAEHSAPGG